MLDIADLYRAEVTIPCAFQAAREVSRHGGTLERLTRRLTGQTLARDGIIPAMINRIKALIERTGRLAPYLLATITYERGELQACADQLGLLQIPPATMLTTYLEALAWADEFEANLV